MGSAISANFQLAGGALEYTYIAGPPNRPVILLLHEGLGCVAMWRDFPQALCAATGCAVLAYSRYGYGGSAPVSLPRPVTYMHHEAQVVLPQVLEAAAAVHGGADVVLVGHSDGGSISIIYNGALPDTQVAGQVLLAPHVFNEAVCVESIRRARQAFETEDLRERLSRYHHNQVDDAFYGWCDVWLSAPFADWNIENYLPKITVPTLLLQGDADEYGTLAQVRAIEAILQDLVTTRIFPGCGHSPHRQAEADVVAEIAGFVRRFL